MGQKPAFGSKPAFAPAAPKAQAPAPYAATAPHAPSAPELTGPLPSDFKERFLAEIQRTNRTFYSLHVAQAQRIDVDARRAVFTFGPVHETMRQQVEQRRQWLESVAESVGSGKVAVATAKGATDGAPERTNAAAKSAAPGSPASNAATPPAAVPDDGEADKTDLKARALADDGVQAMLEIFPAEIREVEEIK